MSKRLLTDSRNLWPEFRRVIGEIKPRWVLAENVPGLFSSDNGDFFGAVIADLAKMGYSVGWCTYGAVDVGALHRRNRVFIVAYSKDSNRRGLRSTFTRWGIEEIGRSSNGQGEMADSTFTGLEGCRRRILETWGDGPACGIGRQSGNGRTTQSDLGVLADGLSARLAGYWAREPKGVPRVATGIKDRVNKLKALGNSVVPAQIYPILKAIAEIEEANR